MTSNNNFQQPIQYLNNKESKGKMESKIVRRRQPFFKKIKLGLLLLVISFVQMNSILNNPLLTPKAAVKIFIEDNKFLFVLLVIEFIRQLHFLAGENIVAYWSVWSKLSKMVNGFFMKLQPQQRSVLSKNAKRITIFVIFAACTAVTLGMPLASTPKYFGKTITSLVKGVFETVSNAGTMIQLVVFSAIGLFQLVMMFWFVAKGGFDVYYPENIKTRFSDVYGQDHVRDRVKEVVDFLENPDLIEENGGHVPGGILLYGPPGTGKTLLAEAIAGETGKPFVSVDPGAFQAMFVGVGNMKVKALYKKLRELATQYNGVIVFFDEADSLGNRGAGVSAAALAPNLQNMNCGSATYLTGASLNAVNQYQDINKVITPINGGGGGGGGLQALLTEMQGLKKPRGFFNRRVRRAIGLEPLQPPKYRILHVMATNMPGTLDPALLRPGRIDRQFRVGYPSKEGRVVTLKNYLAKVPNTITDDQIERLATTMNYGTGAIIKDMVNEGLIMALRDKRTTITWEDLVRAKRFKDLGPSEAVEYVERERHAVAIHEACHATVAFLLRKRLRIDTATIEKGSDYLGFVSSISTDELYTRWKSDYESDICVALASLAGERHFFGSDSTSGVSGDLQTATKIAALMESQWGMGDSLSVTPVMAEAQIGQARGGGGKPASERVEKKLKDLYLKTEKLLVKNQDLVLILAHALETHKTLNGPDVEAILRKEQGELVDGSIYKNPKVVAKIRQYHSNVVSTHSESDSTPVDLPKL